MRSTDYKKREDEIEKWYFQRDFHWPSHSIGEMISIAFEEKNTARNTMIMQTQLQESYRSGPSTKWVKERENETETRGYQGFL
jgi:hypothetical protein